MMSMVKKISNNSRRVVKVLMEREFYSKEPTNSLKVPQI